MPYSTNALTGKIVLVVEDEYMLADAIEAAVRSAGGNVSGPFPTIKEALDHLADERNEPDAGTLNIRLIDGESYPVADELSRRSIPFVLASANSPSSLPKRFSHVPLVTKPFSAYQIVQAISELLRPQQS